ncbi:recombinase family protein [Mycolicibacterium psychrotolerans]|uniref:Integrase n=1 Tax=Mycolicibacterium psychrotolerans TaxID=216929 RepID=A0A7I7MAY1_9MYCO|nr:recombinase family protein [Mycolicibacterium psychrotolerans]BBX69421.1 integrase [Mycolicibacterium psychrotolerans]
MRVLGRLRLSVASDESTSIERQREAVESWSQANGHQVIGWAEDTDVSGSVDPFDTPRLGDWLANRADDFDVIVCWKLDRLGRDAIRLNKLFGWCIDHRKTVVSCSEAIDLGTPVGRLIANVIAFLAEGELEAIRERTISSRRKLRETARWPGGRPPYGYRVVPAEQGSGKVLQIDETISHRRDCPKGSSPCECPKAHAVVRRIVDAVLDGQPLGRIARELNADGILPPADHYRVSVGKPPATEGTWRTWPLKHMLRSPTLVGHAHLGGVTVRDDQGQPVRMAEPLVSDDERELILAELDRTTGAPRERAQPAPLAGIAACFFCGTTLTLTTNKKSGRVYRYYRCPKACSSLIPADAAEELAETTFLDDYGSRDVTERVWVPGDNHETELRAALAAFDELSATAGRMTSRAAQDRLQRQLSALDARIAELESTPTREGRYEDRPTGRKYRDAWEQAAEPAERRELLKRAGITIRIGISGVGKRHQNNGGVWHAEIHSPVPLDETASLEERRKHGVPD